MGKRTSKTTTTTTPSRPASKAPAKPADSPPAPHPRNSHDGAAAAAPGAAHLPPQNDSPWLTHHVTLTPKAPAMTHWGREWLLTNGTGAYSMGTLPGINTRRYHGLLIAAAHPPVSRVVALNQMLEQIVLTAPGNAGESGDGAQPWDHQPSQMLEFSTMQFHGDRGDVFHPAGHEMLRQFAKGLFASWAYTWGEIRLTRELYLHWKEQAATLRYRVMVPSNSHAASLRLSPMLALRDFHSLARHDAGLPYRVDQVDGHVRIRRGDLTLMLTCGGAWRLAESPWWYNVYYGQDAERGQEAQEDYFVPGTFELPITPGKEQEVRFSVALGDRPADPHGWEIDDRARQLRPLVQAISDFGLRIADLRISAAESPHSSVPSKSEIRNPKSEIPLALAIAADDFVIDRTIRHRELKTITAGYPWFADWGRDTFIALPGLLLCTGRYDDARDTLKLYADSIQDGLVPNRFDDYDDKAAHYNTVDASLWFIRAALEYVRQSGDAACWGDWLGDACTRIMDAYIKGTHNGIRMAGDGLITAGSPTTQLTWMDAATSGVVFTPRPGKAVEINALWYAALVGLADLIRTTPGADAALAGHYDKLADRIRRSFAKVFWNDALSCLNDHVYTDEQGQEHVDQSVRPNQIFAASLPASPLPRTKQLQVLDVVRARLLTPVGLRTLPRDDWHYHGRYTGPQFQRDQAYHQGTIWPWLIGPYAEAVLRTGDFSAESRQAARAAVTPLLEDLLGRGLGQLHEIHEAEPPHRPVGTMAQAWSVAELLRVLWLLER
ncbi:MAG: amylo-alpha-1,6-glucosidase [Phycisphaeraceae bacterium]